MTIKHSQLNIRDKTEHNVWMQVAYGISFSTYSSLLDHLGSFRRREAQWSPNIFFIEPFASTITDEIEDEFK